MPRPMKKNPDDSSKEEVVQEAVAQEILETKVPVVADIDQVNSPAKVVEDESMKLDSIIDEIETIDQTLPEPEPEPVAVDSNDIDLEVGEDDHSVDDDDFEIDELLEELEDEAEPIPVPVEPVIIESPEEEFVVTESESEPDIVEQTLEDTYIQPDVDSVDTDEDDDDDLDDEILEVNRIEFPSLGQPIGQVPFDGEFFDSIPVKVKVELGDAIISLKELYALTDGSIIELDKPAGDSLEMFVNGQLIATGEVVAVDDNYGIRIQTVVKKETK